jgi:integrase
MAKTLTSKSVESAKPDPEQRSEIPDAAMPGLYLVVQPTGVKGWAFRYRFAGKPRKMTLGRYPALSLAEAREEARKAARSVAIGTDPGAAKISDRETGRNRVATLIEQFDQRHMRHLKSGAQAKRFLERFVIPAWGDRDVQTITKRDVLELRNEIVDRGTAVTANRVLAHTRKFFNWCVEGDVIERAPTDGVRPAVRETPRDRVLSDDEIRWLWMATGLEGQPFGPLTRVLLLTGQRLREAAAMTDREIDGDVWRLAPARTKNKRGHDVPLSPAVREELAGVRRIGKAGLIFTTNGQTPVSGFERAATRIRAAVAAAAERERGEPVDIPHWTFHDLRRTAVTGMARLGFPVQVVEAVVNHASGAVSGVAAVYNRHDYAAEKRAALDAWARYVLDMT